MNMKKKDKGVKLSKEYVQQRRSAKDKKEFARRSLATSGHVGHEFSIIEGSGVFVACSCGAIAYITDEERLEYGPIHASKLFAERLRLGNGED